MNKKKIIFAGLFCTTFSIGLVGAPILMTPFSVAEAHFMSSAEEHSVGRAAVEKVEEEYETSFDEDIAEIQERLVESNPMYLNMNDGVHKRWLSPMKLYHSDSPNAFMLPGGYSYMSDSMVNFMNTYQNDGYVNYDQLRPLNRTNIYNTSAVAFVMGHEFGHWAGKDHLESYDKQFGMNLLVGLFGGNAGSIGGAMAQSIGVDLVDTLIDRQMSFNQEKGADEWGLKFLENVPEYSIGGALIKFDRFLRLDEIRYPDGKRPKNFRNPHPETQKRFDRVKDYIYKASKERVEMDPVSGQVYLDGRPLPVYGRPDVVDKERGYYIAGQIATAIKKDIFHFENVTLVSATKSDFARDNSMKNVTYVVVSSKDGKEKKVIDEIRYNTSMSYDDNVAKITYSKSDADLIDFILRSMKDYDASHSKK